jgi:hypothetical protein
MQAQLDLDAMIARVASTTLSGHRLARVTCEPDVDFDGADALRVTVVLANDDIDLSGDDAANIIVDLRQALQSAGDDRFPFVDITNESELASDVDPQPEPSA